MRLLVCGGRDVVRAQQRRDEITLHLDTLHAATPIGLLVTGGAQGVDAIAEGWARAKAIPLAVYPAPWQSKLGRAAGPARNAWMLRFGQPDLVLAFPGGAGTRSMCELAEAQGVPLERHGFEADNDRA